MRELRRASPELSKRAQELRRNATPEERLLWSHLRAKRFRGTGWRWQYPVGGYILDFYCPSAKLVIELDGSQHMAPAASEYDRARTEYLNARGYRVLRFRNHELLNDTDAVLARIALELR